MCDVQSVRILLRSRALLCAGDRRSPSAAREFRSDLSGESVAGLVDHWMDRVLRVGV